MCLILSLDTPGVCIELLVSTILYLSNTQNVWTCTGQCTNTPYTHFLKYRIMLKVLFTASDEKSFQLFLISVLSKFSSSVLMLIHTVRKNRSNLALKIFEMKQ